MILNRLEYMYITKMRWIECNKDCSQKRVITGVDITSFQFTTRITKNALFKRRRIWDWLTSDLSDLNRLSVRLFFFFAFYRKRSSKKKRELKRKNLNRRDDKKKAKHFHNLHCFPQAATLSLMRHELISSLKSFAEIEVREWEYNRKSRVNKRRVKRDGISRIDAR